MTRIRAHRAGLAVAIVIAIPHVALAVDVGRAAKFLGGAAVMLGGHEAAHLAFDAVFDARPHVVGVRFGPVPFFAIEPTAPLSPRRRYLITSAGFHAQHGAAELILESHPALHDESQPFLKGMFAFDVLASTGYGLAALARAGPVERDTRAMAEASGTGERAIGALVLAPAALDTYRYFHPRARWARWASRAAKIALLGLVLKGR